MPRIIAHSIIAIADDKDDQFRRSCLDTLRELAVLNIEVVAQCNGVKTLLDAVLDPSNRVSEMRPSFLPACCAVPVLSLCCEVLCCAAS